MFMLKSIVAVLILAISANAMKLQARALGACTAGSPCAEGVCCSQYGYCGVGADYCSSTCNAELSGAGSACGNGANLPISTDGTCGSAAGTKCPTNAPCCSKFGYCGSDAAWCQNCQASYSFFGTCSTGPKPSTTMKSSARSSSSATAKASSTTVKVSSTAKASSTTVSSTAVPTYAISSDGACGPSVKKRCPAGNCCSQFGWCGASASHCTKCDPVFSAAGTCNA